MSVSTVVVRAIIEGAERTGVLPGDLLGRAGIDPRRLEPIDGRFELDELTRLQLDAIDMTGDPALGLHMAEATSERAFDLVAHMIGHAPTVREAVGLAAQFRALLLDGTELAIRDAGDESAIVCAFPRRHPVADRMVAELSVAGFLRLVRMFAGSQTAPRRASFEHPRPAHDAEYARIFGGAERFDEPETSIVFAREAVDRPQIHQHPELYSVLRTEAERRLERVTHGLSASDRLRQYLSTRPPSRIPDMATAARDLGMSERSLRRRLAGDGTSYRDVVRAALETSAGHMLLDPKRTIQETASALGFADPQTFHRAFKRWTGTTPGQYRDARRKR